MALAPTVTYAGVPLLLPDERLQAHLDRHWRPGPEWRHPGYTAPGVMHLPRPYPPEPTRPRLGVLRWPTGASRWATYYGLADAQTLGKIDSAAPSESQPYPLVLSDGVNSVAPVMYMLPPRPLATGLGGDLYLITLVDRRYFWSFSGKITAYSTVPSYASWSDLFADLFSGFVGNIGNGLVNTYTLDAVPSAYKSPSARFNLELGQYYASPLSVVTDAAAEMVGSVVIFGLSGTARVIRPENSRSLLDSQYGSFEGGRVSGGRVPASRLASGLPSLHVMFPGTGIGDPPEVIIPSFDPTTLFPNWANNTISSGYTAQIYADLDASATTSDKTAYANQIGEDWYRRRSADVEAAYQGVTPWQPTGMEDAIEWEIGLGGDATMPTAETRVILPPKGDHNVYGGSPFGDGWPVLVRVGDPYTADPDWLNCTVVGYNTDGTAKSTGDAALVQVPSLATAVAEPVSPNWYVFAVRTGRKDGLDTYVGGGPNVVKKTVVTQLACVPNEGMQYATADVWVVNATDAT